jgi:hypothetical protein
MAASFKSFSSCVAAKTKNITERAIAFLYFRAETSDIPEASPQELCQDFIDAGLGSPNVTRLKQYLAKDPRTAKVGKDKWRLKADQHEEVAQIYSSCLKRKVVIASLSDSVIPKELVSGTKNYLIDVVRQINGCYDADFFDAAGVMMRRLIETLIIEVYEYKRITGKIKDSAGNYLMLNDLIKEILKEPTITLGRNAKKGLGDAKWLGDQSAHNRRFLANQPDIDRVQPNVRILVQELLSIGNLK